MHRDRPKTERINFLGGEEFGDRVAATKAKYKLNTKYQMVIPWRKQIFSAKLISFFRKCGGGCRAITILIPIRHGPGLV
jgi:hypothetical protein